MSFLRRGSLRSGSAGRIISLGAKAVLNTLYEILTGIFKVGSQSVPVIYTHMLIPSHLQVSGDVGG